MPQDIKEFELNKPSVNFPLHGLPPGIRDERILQIAQDIFELENDPTYIGLMGVRQEEAKLELIASELMTHQEDVRSLGNEISKITVQETEEDFLIILNKLNETRQLYAEIEASTKEQADLDLENSKEKKLIKEKNCQLDANLKSFELDLQNFNEQLINVQTDRNTFNEQLEICDTLLKRTNEKVELSKINQEIAELQIQRIGDLAGSFAESEENCKEEITSIKHIQQDIKLNADEIEASLVECDEITGQTERALTETENQLQPLSQEVNNFIRNYSPSEKFKKRIFAIMRVAEALLENFSLQNLSSTNNFICEVVKNRPITSAVCAILAFEGIKLYIQYPALCTTFAFFGLTIVVIKCPEILKNQINKYYPF